MERLEELDLSHNQILRVEENSFTGLTLAVLQLSNNLLRRVPGEALRGLASVSRSSLSS